MFNNLKNYTHMFEKNQKCLNSFCISDNQIVDYGDNETYEKGHQYLCYHLFMYI